jgi:hypothetical protein
MDSSRVKEIKKGATSQKSHLFIHPILNAWSGYVKKKRGAGAMSVDGQECEKIGMSTI